MRTFPDFFLAFALAAASSTACSENNTSGTNNMATSGTDMSAPVDLVPPVDLTPPPVPGSVQFIASGQELAVAGYAFPAATDDPAFVDGWEVNFDEVLVTFDNISLSENPDKSAIDQSQTDAKVASVSGPWAVDLHKAGPLTSKEGGENQAVAIATINNQNLNGNTPFDPTKRYAFGYDVVPAVATAKSVNMDAQGKTDYQLMVQKKWTVLYVGTATFKGVGCISTIPTYDFTKLPTVVKFKIGFTSPSMYVNCQNPENEPAAPLGTEDFQRGIQINDGTTTVAELTMQTERPFWQSFAGDSAFHFDQLAALAKKDASNKFVVTEAELKGVNYTAFKDAAAAPLPWRSCVAGYTPPPGLTSMGFDTVNIPYNPTGNPAQVIRDYLDYTTYLQSTQGKLNADGHCFVKRGYPSPQ